MFVWVNGQYLEENQPSILVTDRGFLYGFGLFESIRLYPASGGFGKPFRLEDHVHRMNNSAKRLGIPIDVSLRSFREIIERLVKLNSLPTGRLRIILTAGTKSKKYLPTYVVQTLPVEDYTDSWERGTKIGIAPYRRSTESPIYQHKTLNYLENILFREEAQRKKMTELIFTNTRDELTEGAISNIFIVKDEEVFTPPLSANILPGITRQIICNLCKELAIKVHRKVLYEDAIINADEVFITNSIIEVMPIFKCDNYIIGNGEPGEITKQLQAAYKQLVNRSLK
jgi:branched-chain amino acid aminotransferase group I